MKKLIVIVLLGSLRVSGQVSLISGEYRELKIAYDKQAKTVTGFYESGTGYDENTKSPRFTCIFYLEGKLSGDKAKIRTYYPTDIKRDLIIGELRVMNNRSFKVHLPEEHGGCWNVEHFADEPVDFSLAEAQDWVQIRYVVQDKIYFYLGKSDAGRQKAYLVKGDIVYIEKIEDKWALCSFRGKKTTKGWVRLEGLNHLD